MPNWTAGLIWKEDSRSWSENASSIDTAWTDYMYDNNLRSDPAQSWTAHSNITGTTSSSVLYYALSGFGITWSYFFTHLGLLFVACTGLILNAIALKIVSVKSPMQDASRIFISNLAMSDISIGVICIYTVLYNLIHYKNYYECALRTGIATSTNLNSSMHLLFLTFDRYFKIMHPYKYIEYFNNEKRLATVSRCIWITAGVLGILPILGWRRPPVKGITYCSYFGVLDKNYLLLMVTFFFAILFILLYCYISIICGAWNQRKRVMETPRDTKNSYDHRNTKALWWEPTKTVIILISLYSCCWIPTGVVVLIHLADAFPASYTDDKKGVILAYVSSFVFLNIIANPIIYAFKIRRVKQKVRSMINNISSEARFRQKQAPDLGCNDVIRLNDLLKSTIKNQINPRTGAMENNTCTKLS